MKADAEVSRSSSATSILWFLPIAGLLACSDPEPSGKTICEWVDCSRECEDLRVQACDVTSAACQELVRRSVECVRKLRFDDPLEVRFVERQDAGGETPASDDQRTDSPSRAMLRDMPLPVPPGPDDPQVYYYNSSLALQRLGLLDPELDLVTAFDRTDEMVAGRYSPMSRELLVVLDQDVEAWSSMTTLAHEMIHALQDQELDLDAYGEQLREDGVEARAYRAMFEGEADFYDLLTTLFMLGSRVELADIESWLRWNQKQLQRAVYQSEYPIVSASRWMVYSVGARYHFERWKQDGAEGTNQLQQNFPADLAAWMRLDQRSTRLSFSCDDLAGIDFTPSVEAGAGDAGRLGASPLSRFGYGAAGILPLLLKGLGEEDQPDFAHAWEAAAHTTGDCMEVYAERAHRLAASLVVDSAAVVTSNDAGAVDSTEQTRFVPRTPVSAAEARDAGATSGSTDAGAEAGAWPPLAEHYRKGDVAVRWVMEFDEVAIAKRVADSLEGGWSGAVDVIVERSGRRVTLRTQTLGQSGYDSALTECAPLYPFDPNEIHVVDSGIAHWSSPEFGLGVLPPQPKLQAASISPSGEFVYGKHLFTPDTCAPIQVTDEAFEVSTGSSDPSLYDQCTDATQQTRAGEILRRCGGEWFDETSEPAFDSSLGVLLSGGPESTLLLDTGVFHRDLSAASNTSSGEPEATSADSDGGVDASAPSDAAPPVVTDWGTLYPFAHGAFERTEAVVAARSTPNGYWLALDTGTSAELWFVDLRGKRTSLGRFPALPAGERTLGSTDRNTAALDAWGALYQLTADGLVRRDLYGHSERVATYPDSKNMSLVTGP